MTRKIILLSIIILLFFGVKFVFAGDEIFGASVNSGKIGDQIAILGNGFDESFNKAKDIQCLYFGNGQVCQGSSDVLKWTKYILIVKIPSNSTTDNIKYFSGVKSGNKVISKKIIIGPKFVIKNEKLSVVSGDVFYPYKKAVGINLASGDVDGDKKAELIVAKRSGKNNEVRIFEINNKIKENKSSRFMPFGKNYAGGINLAVGDVNGDGVDEIICAKANSEARIIIYNAKNKKILKNFKAFSGKIGVNVGVGNVLGSKADEIIVAAGARIKAFNGKGKALNFDIYPFGKKINSRLNLALGDVNGDKVDEIIISQGFGDEAWVKVYSFLESSSNITNKISNIALSTFRAHMEGEKFGANLASGDIDNDGLAEILTLPSKKSKSYVKILDVNGIKAGNYFLAFGEGYLGEVKMAFGGKKLFFGDENGRVKILNLEF